MNLRKIHSLAKVIGTVVTVSGAMVMTLYKGPELEIIKGHGGGNEHESGSSEASEQNFVVGTVMLIASCGGWASFFILQVIHYILSPHSHGVKIFYIINNQNIN